MDFTPTETQAAVRDVISDVLDRDTAGWKALADANLLGVAVPPEQGGEGLGLLEVGTMLHEAGRRAATLPIWETLACAVPTLTRCGSEEQRRRVLPEVVTGDSVVAVALNEPGTAMPLIRGLLDASARDLVPGDTLKFFIRVTDTSPRRQTSVSRTVSLRLPGMTELRDQSVERADDLLDEAERLAQAAAELQQTAAQREQEILGPVMQRIGGVIEEVRQAGGYSLILDAAAGSVICTWSASMRRIGSAPPPISRTDFGSDCRSPTTSVPPGGGSNTNR